MTTNRAIEFLNEAYSLLGYPGNDDRARMLVRLAVREVEELLDALGRQAATATGDGRGVLIVNAQPMTAALLTESQRAATALEWRRRSALPGNGRG